MGRAGEEPRVRGIYIYICVCIHTYTHTYIKNRLGALAGVTYDILPLPPHPFTWRYACVLSPNPTSPKTFMPRKWVGE